MLWKFPHTINFAHFSSESICDSHLVNKWSKVVIANSKGMKNGTMCMLKKWSKVITLYVDTFHSQYINFYIYTKYMSKRKYNGNEITRKLTLNWKQKDIKLHKQT